MEDKTNKNDIEVIDTSVYLGDSLAETILNDHMKDILIDASELGLDAMMDDGIMKEIPIVSLLYKTYKIGHLFHERAFIRKLVSFLNCINDGTLSEPDRLRYINELKNDKKKRNKEIEYVLILIDRFTQNSKAVYLAKLYMAYLGKRISWQLFCQFSEIIDRLLPGDEKCLDNMTLTTRQDDPMIQSALQRLQGLGIILPKTVPNLFNVKGETISVKDDGTYELTHFGRILFEIIGTSCEE